MESYKPLFDKVKFGTALKVIRKRHGKSQAVIGDIGDDTRNVDVRQKGRYVRYFENQEKDTPPSYEIIHQWAENGDFEDFETHYLLGLAGHLRISRPSLTEITDLLKPLIGEMNRHPYPYYIADMAMNFWVFNPASEMIVDRDVMLAGLRTGQFSALELLYHPKHKLVNRIDNGPKVQKSTIQGLITLNQNRQYEPFFQNYSEKLRQRLSDEPDAYNAFVADWDALGSLPFEPTRPITPFTTSNHVLNLFDCTLTNGSRCVFQINPTIIRALDDIFIMGKYEPLPEYEQSHLGEFFDRYRTRKMKKSLVLWELIDDMEEYMANWL